MSAGDEQNQPPYFLTLAVLAFGWTITRYANNQSLLPIIAWDLEKCVEEGNYIGVYTMNNICKDKVFRDVEFILYADHFGDIKSELIYSPPGAGLEVSDPKVVDKKLSFVLSEFHPGWQIKLRVVSSGNQYPKINIKSPKSAVRLMRENLKTKIIKFEFEILLIVLVILAGIISPYLIKWASENWRRP